MSCKHDCPKPPAFPRTIFNRPGLPTIDYRIGRYAEVRAHLIDQLNRAGPLAAWTHRGSDDPGIALLEGDAIVIDILTFYQSLYANEAYLRTAEWRDSVADLVRLGGYRLAPGVAGETTFALTVKGQLPVTVPMGFGLKAQLDGIEKPVEFETRAALEALPALGAFSLYRPRTTPALAAGAGVLRLGATAGALEAGDRLMVSTVSSTAVNTRLLDPEIVVVEETWSELGQRFARLESPLRRTASAASLRAYKLGASFRHFGHNSADRIATVSSQGVPSQRATSFVRYANVTTIPEVTPDLAPRDFPLDRTFDEIVAGDLVLVQGRFSISPSSFPHRFTLARRVTETEPRSLAWGTVSAGATMLTLDQDLLVTISGSGYPYADVRTLSALQVIGMPFDVYAAPVPTAATAGDQLLYFGVAEDARALAGRRLLLAHADGVVDDRVVQHATVVSGAEPAFHTLRLSHPVAYADFGYPEPAVTVYGNVVDASQGKTIARAPIGSGDARELFQTFPLPKTPLTYLFDATQTPAQSAELEIFVDDIRWERRETLFGAGPDDRVYIVREDAVGASFVQFGDGKMGARLSSGRNNVLAGFRVGIAAHGVLKPDTKPQATGKLQALDKVFLPVEVDTGAPAESADNAKRAAPPRLQSIGRLVSLADYEAETRMLPNVVKANARWDLVDGAPGIVLTVLTASGSEADVVAIREALATFNRSRGPDRHTLWVRRGHRQFVHVHATVGYDPAYTLEKLTPAIEAELGVGGRDGGGIDVFPGLFGLDRRDFRQSVHTSEIIGAIQNVPGVAWVTLQAAAPLALGTPPETDPANLPLPAVDLIPTPAIPCVPRALLSLQRRHLVMGFVAAEATTECGT